METETPKIIYINYSGDCEHCGAFIHTDYVKKPKVRKHKFPCPGCGKVIVDNRKLIPDDPEEADVKEEANVKSRRS